MAYLMRVRVKTLRISGGYGSNQKGPVQETVNGPNPRRPVRSIVQSEKSTF